MDSLDDLIKSAKKFNLESLTKDRRTSLNINAAISALSQLVIQGLLITGAFFGLKNSGHTNLVLILGIAFIIFILAELFGVIETYKLKKQLELEYENFITHMEKEGFSRKDMTTLTKSLTKEQLTSKFKDNP